MYTHGFGAQPCTVATPAYATKSAPPSLTGPRVEVQRYSVVESAASDVSSTNAQLAGLVDQVRNIADAYFGSADVGRAEMPQRPPAGCKSESLVFATSATFSLINDLREQIDRLGGI